MDHHCWWTNNCVGYGTLRPFFLFCIYLSTLTIFGLSTIVYNIYTKNREYEEGMQSLFNPAGMFPNFSDSTDSNPLLKQFDSLLFHVSGLGVMAMAMTFGLTYGVMKNTNRIESVKDQEMSQSGTKVYQRPTRTFRQAMMFIFGTESLSLKCLLPL